MFAPNQQAAAEELLRVWVPGGRIGLANWVPEGKIAEFFGIVSEYAPPPPGLDPPTRWGTEAGLRELFSASTRSIETKSRIVTEHFRSIEHALTLFRDYFGPTRRAFEALDAEGQRALARDLGALFERTNTAKDGSLALPFEYLEVLITR
jgi:hypothetical protein